MSSRFKQDLEPFAVHLSRLAEWSQPWDTQLQRLTKAGRTSGGDVARPTDQSSFDTGADHYRRTGVGRLRVHALGPHNELVSESVRK